MSAVVLTDSLDKTANLVGLDRRCVIAILVAVALLNLVINFAWYKWSSRKGVAR